MKDLAGLLNLLSLNTLIFHRPLSESSYMDLPDELKSLRKGLINIKNKDKKCFYGVMLDILILKKKHPERIKKTNKKIAEELSVECNEGS